MWTTAGSDVALLRFRVNGSEQLAPLRLGANATPASVLAAGTNALVTLRHSANAIPVSRAEVRCGPQAIGVPSKQGLSGFTCDDFRHLQSVTICTIVQLYFIFAQQTATCPPPLISTTCPGAQFRTAAPAIERAADRTIVGRRCAVRLGRVFDAAASVWRIGTKPSMSVERLRAMAMAQVWAWPP
jgi:hypothetical protein